VRASILLGLGLCLAAGGGAQALSLSEAGARLRQMPAGSPEQAAVNVFSLMNRILRGPPTSRRPHEWTASQALQAGSSNGCVESAKVFFSLFKEAYPSFDAAYVDSFNSSGNGGHAVVEVTSLDGLPLLVDSEGFKDLPHRQTVTEEELSRPVDIRPELRGKILQFIGRADLFFEKTGTGYRAGVYPYGHVFEQKQSEKTFGSLEALNLWLGEFSDVLGGRPLTFSDIKGMGLILAYDDPGLSSFQYRKAKHVIYGCYRRLPAKDEAESIEPGARDVYESSRRALSCGAAGR